MVIFCGAGFVGSWCIRFFSQRARAMSVSESLLVIDDGLVEERNLPTQLFTYHQVGSSKAEECSQCARSFGLQSEYLDQRLDYAEVLKLETDDEIGLVVDCFDNLESRILAKILAQRMKCECLHLSLSRQGYGRVEWSDKWAHDPSCALFSAEAEKVELPPCELILHHQVGIATALRGTVTATDYLITGKKQSWMITDKTMEVL